MDENEFEGTFVLEKIAEINKLDVFWKAIDSDDFGKVKSLMKMAKIDAATISMVLKKMHMED